MINIGCIGLFFLWLFCLLIMISLLYANFASKGHVNFIPKQHGYVHSDLSNHPWISVSNASQYSHESCSSKKKENAVPLNWRWKTLRCELERFEVKTFLGIVRGKTLTFIGDAVARNQMESLLCLLSQEQTPVNKYSDSDNLSTEWYFSSHSFTVKLLWTEFFVMAKERVINDTNTGVYDVHLDRLDNNWTHKLPGTSIAIISNAHWFFRPLYLHERGVVTGCVYCDAKNVRNIRPVHAFQKMFQMVLKHISDCNNCGNLLTLVKPFSPVLFGNRSDGRRYKPEELNIRDTAWEFWSIQVNEILRAGKNVENRSKRFAILDVTKATSMRPGAHLTVVWDKRNDFWNDLLMAVLKNHVFLRLL